LTPLLDQERVQDLLIPKSGWIRDFVSAYAPYVEAPEEALAGMAYTLIATATGWRSYLQWADSREPLTLFTVLVGGSASAHKTTVLKIGGGIAKDANTMCREIVGAGPDDPDFIKVITGGHTSQAGLLREISPPDAETAEKWGRENPPGMLLEWDELKDLVVDKGAGGYSFLSDTRQMLLRLYGGWSPGSSTLANPFPASRVAVSMVGTITSDDWTEKLSPDAVTGGMMGRLFAIPTGKSPKHHPRPSQVNAVERNRLVDWLAAYGALPHATFGAFQFTPEAGEFWDTWYVSHKEEIDRMEGSDPVLAAARGTLFNRYQAITQKFAGIQGISQWSGDPTEVPTPTADLQTIQSACAYADLALNQASQVAADILESADERFQRRLTSVLLESGPVAIADLQRKVRIRGIDSSKWHRNLDLCVYTGLVEKNEETRNTSTGPRKRILVSLPHAA